MCLSVALSACRPRWPLSCGSPLWRSGLVAQSFVFFISLCTAELAFVMQARPVPPCASCVDQDHTPTSQVLCSHGVWNCGGFFLNHLYDSILMQSIAYRRRAEPVFFRFVPCMVSLTAGSLRELSLSSPICTWHFRCCAIVVNWSIKQLVRE